MGRHVHSTPTRTGLPGHRAADVHRPEPASATTAVLSADDVVAIRALPAVPPTGPQPAVGRPADAPRTAGPRHVVVPRSVARKEAARAESSRRAARLGRGRRLHGVLVYATGVLLVLSSVYGVAHAVGGGNVVTETASGFRNWCAGWGSGSGSGWGSGWVSGWDSAGDDEQDEARTADTSAASGEVADAADAGTSGDTAAAPAPGDAPGAQDGGAQDGGAQDGGAQEGSGGSAAARDGASAPAGAQDEVGDPAEADSASDERAADGATAAVPQTPTAPQPARTAGASPSTATSLDGAVPSGTWLSGAAGDGVTDGSFAAWRGTPLGIAGTWADNNEAMVELWQLRSGGDYADWDQALDIAIGGIGEGETWAAAADGAYDDRWRESLTNLRELWGDRTAPLFIRFAHEMNGDWYDWAVDAGNAGDFVTAWRGFRALQQEIFPESQLVFAVNRESVGNDMDWRDTFPGAEHVDVMGVDYYNQYPSVSSAADWERSLTEVDEWGAPKGLQAHLDFARSVGLPLGVPEWSGKAENADSAAWMQGMHDFFAANAGGGAGQVVYDVQFNIDMHDDSYRVFPETRMPQSAQAYRDAF